MIKLSLDVFINYRISDIQTFMVISLPQPFSPRNDIPLEKYTLIRMEVEAEGCHI